MRAHVQVCRKALQLLAQVEHEPLLNLEELNPELLQHAEPMAQAHSLRQRLRLLGDYLLTCRSGACKKLQARCVCACVFHVATVLSNGCVAHSVLPRQNGAADVPVGDESPVQCRRPAAGT